MSQLVNIGQSFITPRPAEAFQVTGGQNKIQENVLLGKDEYSPDIYSKESMNKDRDFNGYVNGTANKPTSETNVDKSCRMWVEGTQQKRWTTDAQVLDFTIFDADDHKNLTFQVQTDFEGDGRAVITDTGMAGGSAQIQFPLGNLSGAGRTRYLLSEYPVENVQIHKEKDFSRITVDSPNGRQRIFQVKEGTLFEEVPENK
jgi:hypothetical protein